MELDFKGLSLQSIFNKIDGFIKQNPTERVLYVKNLFGSLYFTAICLKYSHIIDIF